MRKSQFHKFCINFENIFQLFLTISCAALYSHELFMKLSTFLYIFIRQFLHSGAILPVMYIYDSYVFPSSAWWELLSERGNLTLRGTELDAIYIGLLVESSHRNHIKKSHFDGFYTYFGINGFSFGSSWKNWRDLNKFANQNGLLFIPSLGPGYTDTQVSQNKSFA